MARNTPCVLHPAAAAAAAPAASAEAAAAPRPRKTIPCAASGAELEKTDAAMPKNMRPVVKLEDGEGGAEAEGGLQEEAGAGGGVQRRCVGEAGDAAWDEVLRANAEAQAQAIRGMEQVRVMEARVAELAAEVKIKAEALESKEDLLQAIAKSKDEMAHAKDALLQAKDVIIQSKDSEIRLLHADNARLSAECAAAGSAPRPPPAPAETLFQEGQRLFGEQRFSEAAERWGRAALLRQVPSHAHLSVMLIFGKPGVAKDDKRAFKLATAGAKLGCAHSKGALGLCYVLGYGVAGDAARGLALGRESDAAGSCFGQFVVGACYYNGCGGVAKDYAEAVRLFRLAAEQGDAGAQNNLGGMFEKGQGVAQDYAEALRLLRLSAAQGDAAAQVNLGVMFSNGQGVAQDYAEAVRLYRLAAEQGDAGAQFNLGVMFSKGKGVAQDRAEAIRWYRLAAAQGHAAAQRQLTALGA
jgi:TPR repeat protein